MNPIAIYLVLFIVAILASLFYWQIVHKVVIKYLLYRLFARRDHLRSLAITKQENHSSFTYQETEGFICKTISVVPSIGLMSFFWFAIHNPNPPSSKAERFREEASSEIAVLHDETTRDALIIMFFNSPILFLVGFGLSFALWIVGRFNKIIVIRKAESFVGELPPGTELQTA